MHCFNCLKTAMIKKHCSFCIADGPNCWMYHSHVCQIQSTLRSLRNGVGNVMGHCNILQGICKN